MNDSAARRDWNKMEQKREAIVDVLKHLKRADDNVRNQCVAGDAKLRHLFEDPNIGNIDVPSGIKTVAMPEGERERKAKGSVVLELPPKGKESPSPEKPSPPDPILVHLLCCYKVW